VIHGIAGWQIEDDSRAGESAQQRVARDAALLEAVRRGEAPPSARVWENVRCLVAARSDQRLPRFAAAAEALGAAGWPVLVRESGGSAVPQGPGILCLSLAFRPEKSAPCTIESSYDALCRPLEAALAKLGVACSRSEVRGAFCDGRYDLAVLGRKIAGTAQRWRAGPGGPAPGRGALLAHAVLLVDADLGEASAAVNRFYEAAGGERRCHAAASITLREALATGGSPLAGAPSIELRATARAALLAALRDAAGCA
jgi:octanoyl-[GcvH]:protein N-octanoyltransferase